jgi:hypothetical protein
MFDGTLCVGVPPGGADLARRPPALVNHAERHLAVFSGDIGAAEHLHLDLGAPLLRLDRRAARRAAGEALGPLDALLVAVAEFPAVGAVPKARQHPSNLILTTD